MANTANQKKSAPAASSTADAGEAEVQERADRETDQGYRGTVADPTPNHAYTVAGVTSGEPTPETDEDAASAADAYQADREGQAMSTGQPE